MKVELLLHWPQIRRHSLKEFRTRVSNVQTEEISARPTRHDDQLMDYTCQWLSSHR
jgi:hypothetical protein